MKLHVVFLFLFALVRASYGDNISKIPKVPPEVAKVLRERQITPESAVKFLDNLKGVDWKKFANPGESAEQKVLKLARLLMTNFEESFPKKVQKKEPQLKQIDSDNPECEKVLVDENGEKFCAVSMKNKEKSDQVKNEEQEETETDSNEEVGENKEKTEL